MATRTSALQRALNYFRSADVDEVRVAFTLAKEIVERRLAQVPSTARPPQVKRTRKPNSSQTRTDIPAQNSANTESLGDA